jgi:hypothetical protein
MSFDGRMLTMTGTYDEALERFHRTGPEFDGWLSNHGPMVIEALTRRDQDASIHAWVDAYAARLDELPRSRWPIADDEWQDVIGDPSRSADWIELMRRQLRERSWSDVLALWWPRLLPGIAGGATHGVIRTGHAVQALRSAVTPPRIDELAHALGYWAGRWQPLEIVHPEGAATPGRLIDALPTVPRQEWGIRTRLAQLPALPAWSAQAARLAAPGRADQVPSMLEQVIDAVVVAYPRIAHGQPTMLVHAATAPNAVAMTLPVLPMHLWRPSFDAAWTATAAVLAAYKPAASAAPVRPRFTGPGAAEAAWAAAVGNGGDHVIKFADTALRSYDRTGDPVALAGIDTTIRLGI